MRILSILITLVLVAGIPRSSSAQPTAVTLNPPASKAECTDEQKKLAVETDAPAEGSTKTVFEGDISPCVDTLEVTVYEEPEIVPAPSIAPATQPTAPPAPSPDWLTVGAYVSATTYGPFGDSNWSPNVFKAGLSLRHQVKRWRWLTAELDLDGGVCRRADKNLIAAGGSGFGDIRASKNLSLGFGLSGNYCLDSDSPKGELTNSHQWSLIARATIGHRVQATLGPTYASWFNQVGKHGSDAGLMLGIALPF